MNRLIEKTVFCGLVTAWRFAACPTNRSPLFVHATIDGVVRAPSLFSKTTGSPPSITAIQELVVPKSIPKTLAIENENISGRDFDLQGLEQVPGQVAVIDTSSSLRRCNT